MNAGSVWVSAGPPTWTFVFFGFGVLVEAALVAWLIVLTIKDR